MSEPERVARLEIRLYMEHAQEMLAVAALNLAEGIPLARVPAPSHLQPRRFPLPLIAFCSTMSGMLKRRLHDLATPFPSHDEHGRRSLPDG
jgi:hypothetical protein